MNLSSFVRNPIKTDQEKPNLGLMGEGYGCCDELGNSIKEPLGVKEATSWD